MDRKRLEELCTEVERTAELVCSDPEAADEAIKAFNAKTGHEYLAFSFAASAEQIVDEAQKYRPIAL